MKRGTASRVFFGVDKTNEDFGGLLLLSQVTLGKKSGMFDEHKGLCIVDNVLLGKGIARVISVIIRGTSPLSLPDAIADSLSYVKAFGGTEQRNLPDGYTQLEYIESTGTQWIDTGIVPNANLKVTGAFAITDISASRNYIVGVTNGGTGRFQFSYSAEGFFGFGSNYDRPALSPNTNKHIFEADKNAFKIDGDTVYTPSSTSFIGDKTMVMFASRDSSSVTTLGKEKVYDLQMYDNGTPVRDFIPAKNSSGVVGMYDTVNGVFYQNAGTGNFVAGDPVVPTPDAPMDIVCNNGVLKARHQSGLPLGYTLLEYIESSGTQYFDIGVNGNATFIGTAQSTTNSPTTSQVLMANGGAGAGRWFGVQSPGVGTGFAKKWGLGASASASTTIDGTTKVDFEITFSDVDGQYGTVNDQTITRTTSIPTQTDWIAFAGATTPLYGFIGKVWSLKVVQNDVLVRNFVPVKNALNVIGMYDFVSGQFFTNQGTGDFVAGSTVSDPVEIYTDGTVETINVHGKNLFDKAQQSTDYYYNNSGEEASVTYLGVNFVHSAKIPCKPNTQYVLSGTRNLSGDQYYYKITFWDKNGDFISYENPAPVSAGNYVRNITTPNNCYYIAFNSFANDTDVQLEQGSTATDYEPYYDGGTATAEMLLKVGDYQDVQSILDGVVTRKVGVLVLDGTEQIWGSVSQTPDKVTILTNCYTVAVPLGDAPIDKRRVYCTHLNSSDTLPAANARQGYALLGNSGTGTPEPLTNKYAVGLGLTTRFPTIAGLKQWLAQQYNAGTPVIVVYPLSTATTESVAGQTLQVTDGDNVLEITQASLDGLELEAQYQAAVSLTIQEVQDANLDPNVEVTIN